MSGSSCDRKYEWLSEQMREMRVEFFIPFQYLSILHQRILKHFLHWYDHEDLSHRSFSRWYKEIKKDFRGELDHIGDAEFDTLIDELFAKLGCGECRNRVVYDRYRDIYQQIAERFGGRIDNSSSESIFEGVKQVISRFQFSLISADVDIVGILLVLIDALQADSLDIVLPMTESACTSLNECIRAIQERNAVPSPPPHTHLSTDGKLDLIIELLMSYKPIPAPKQGSGNGSKVKPYGKSDMLSTPPLMREYKAEFPIPEPYRSWMNAIAPHIFWGKVGATRTAFPSYIMKRLGFPDNATLLESWIDGAFGNFLQLYQKDHGELDQKMLTGFSTRVGELFDSFRPRNEYITDVIDSYIRERGNPFELTVLSLDSPS